MGVDFLILVLNNVVPINYFWGAYCSSKIIWSPEFTFTLLNIKNKAILLDGRLPGEPNFINFKINYDNELNENLINQTNENKIKLTKLKERKYLLQLFNENKLILETNDFQLDLNPDFWWAILKF